VSLLNVLRAVTAGRSQMAAEPVATALRALSSGASSVGRAFDRAAVRTMEKADGPRHALSRLIDTPAGPMRVDASGSNRRSMLSFAREGAERDVSPSEALAAMRQVADTYGDMLGGIRPKELTFAPTSASRSKLYNGLLRRLAARNPDLAFEYAGGVIPTYARQLSAAEDAADLAQWELQRKKADRIWLGDTVFSDYLARPLNAAADRVAAVERALGNPLMDANLYLGPAALGGLAYMDSNR
jgi:hypothetical protein